jgi:hypothetical protein
MSQCEEVEKELRSKAADWQKRRKEVQKDG